METITGRKRSRGCLWAFLVLAGVLALVVVALGVLAVAGGAILERDRPHRGGEDEYPRLKTVWSYGAGEVVAARIAVRGPIVHDAGKSFFGPALDRVEQILRQIRAATVDPDVKAIILEIDSPGGGITASDVIFQALTEFKRAEDGRRVVALLEDLATSGAYYVASAADAIVAHPTTLTGSIGVILSTLNIRGLAQKIGVEDVTIKSGENKDLLNPFREVSEEDRRILQDAIDEMYTHFVGIVARSRGLPEEAVREIADGSVFTASRALEYGLVDQIGYWPDAVAKTGELLGVAELRVIRYEHEFSLAEFLSGMAAWDLSPRALLQDSHTRLMYLWRP